MFDDPIDFPKNTRGKAAKTYHPSDYFEDCSICQAEKKTVAKQLKLSPNKGDFFEEGSDKQSQPDQNK